MNEKLMELLEEVQKNEELQAKMKEAQNIEELYAVTTKYVNGYSLDELKEGLKFIKSQTSESNGELSDEELEMVAGGSKPVVTEKWKDELLFDVNLFTFTLDL